MKDKCKKRCTENGLIFAGAIVLIVGLTIALFKELNIPRYWIPVVVGIALMVLGIAAKSIKRLEDHHNS